MARKFKEGRSAALAFTIVAILAFTVGWWSSRLPIVHRSGDAVSVPASTSNHKGFSKVLKIADKGSFLPQEKRNIAIYKQLRSSVVNITTQDAGYNLFLQPVSTEGASGSGAIISAKGIVVTNNHVVSGASKVYVTLASGQTLPGKVLGKDTEDDISVISITPPKGVILTAIPIGDSSSLQVGQIVYAIGNPYEFQLTMTSGIISGLHRPIRNGSSATIRDMIQTDTPINPGNSGGPLINTQGQMIGINTLIYSPSGGSIGIGFASPVNRARRVVSDLIKYGKVMRGTLDASVIAINPSFAQAAGLPVSQGLLVSQAPSSSAAGKAGLRGGTQRARYGSTILYLGGDIITAINGEPITSLGDFYAALEPTRAGDTVNLTIRRGAKTLSLKVPLVLEKQASPNAGL